MSTVDSPIIIDSTTGELEDAGGGDVVLAEESSRQFIGIIDDFRMYNSVPDDVAAADRARRELDDDEAADAGLLVYLKFGEGTGATAFDSSTGAHDATLHGATAWVGFEGTTDLAGTRKPLSWGVRRMRKGVLVDQQRVVYQLNIGQTQAITPLENGYASLTYDGDLADIYDWTPVAGHYATQLSHGLVRLDALPDSNAITLAFDVLGDVDPDTGYSDVTATIMRNIWVRKAGVDPVEGVDTAAVAFVEGERPDSVGYATGGSAVSILTALNDLSGGVDGWWTMLRDGRATIGLRDFPGDPEFQLDIDTILVDGLEKQQPSSVPIRQWTLSCADFEVTVPPDKVAGAIPATHRSRYTKSQLLASSLDLGPDFMKVHKNAIYATGATFYDSLAAARRECFRRAAIDQYQWDVYIAQLFGGIFQFRVGQPGLVTWPRWGLESGNRYLVGGYEEATDTRQVSLYLWGRKV